MRTSVVLLLLACACAGAPVGPAGTTADAGSTTSGGQRWTTEVQDPTTGTTGTTGTTAASTTVSEPELPSEGFHCDPRLQDCPAGHKCTPFAADMGEDWNGARCVPLAVDPAGLGEPCETEGYPHSGIDDCGPGLMCWYFESNTDLHGRCLGLCDQDDGCVDPDARCYVQQSVSYLCYPLCDPLAQDCPPPATLCVRSSSVDGFICRYAPAGEPAGAGMPCAGETECAPGHVCDPADLVIGCAGERCCAPLCSLSQPSCPAELPQCQAYDPAPPPEYADLGVCRAA
ncbi:hypothetical protein [Nannocystis pusilla]|uniref:hypothetical protein n=1 Tax=Nannocystis pusilla TaxID=889268 RepID=UPI003BF420DE